jgi:hypothetical protein
MKKIFFVIISGFVLAGCSKNELNTYPNNVYTEATFWTSEKNAMAALSGCYQALTFNGIYGYATPLWEETATPNAYNYDNSAGFGLIALGTHNAANATTGNIIPGVIGQRWLDCYKGIGRVNTLLARIDGIVMSDALKNRAKAEAKFLRALFYSLLEMYYGDAPLILDPPNLETQSSLPRTPRADVVQQVIKDLDEAAAVLPVKFTGGDIGRATKGAALALKARVLLFEASALNNANNDVTKWTAAAAAAKAVMDLPGTGYDLFADYRALFLPANENSKECVFDVQYSIVTLGLGSAFDLVDRQYNTNAPLRNIIDAYDMKDGLPPAQSPLYNPATPYVDRDPRMYKTIVYPGDIYIGKVTTATEPFKQTGYGVKKYSIYDTASTTNLINQAGRSEINYMVIRYADVLLMYAEAQNEAVGPDATVYNAVNRIRERAGLSPHQIPAGKTKEEMREIIRHERRIELAFEGFYYTDIRRWKIAENVMPGAVHNSQNLPLVTRSFNKDRDYWWPVSQVQRDLNPNLEQTKNY